MTTLKIHLKKCKEQTSFAILVSVVLLFTDLFMMWERSLKSHQRYEYQTKMTARQQEVLEVVVQDISRERSRDKRNEILILNVFEIKLKLLLLPSETYLRVCLVVGAIQVLRFFVSMKLIQR